MSYLGDIVTSQVLYFHFTTRQFSTGSPITSASLVLSVYKDDNTTQSTAGITTTFTSGFDNVAGLVSAKIDTSADGAFYAAGHDFSVVVTAGTADSVSIVGEVVGYFSINNRSALRPTTAGRTLVVDASGLADANAVKVGPTGSGTAQTARDIGASVLLSTGTGTGQLDFTSGVVKANLAQILGTALTETAGLLAGGFKKFFNISTPAATMDHLVLVDTVTTATTATNLTNAPTAGDLTATMKTSVTTAATAATPSVTVSDKTGFALTSAYDAAKTALQSGGSVVATNMRGTDNALLASGYTAPDNASVTAIKTQTDKLAFTVTNQVDANTKSINSTTITGNGQPGTEFGV